jgi:general secretion pathway protein N
MTSRGRIAGMALASLLLASVAAHLALAANSPLDSPPRNDDAPPLGAAPIAPSEKPMSGNPLWGVPLSSLRATRERPLFVPSRRPPAPPVVATRPAEPVKAPPPPPPEPEKPALTLIGVVAGASDGFAVFTDQATHDIVRLKTGEGHDGWILRSVSGREAILEKNRRTAVIGLPAPTGELK